jgi:hypothetical protein
LHGEYFGSSQWLGDQIRADREQRILATVRAEQEAAEQAQRESEVQRAAMREAAEQAAERKRERECAAIAAGRRELAKRFHPDRNPAGAAKMEAVNRIADQLAAGVRRFQRADLAIALEIFAAGRHALELYGR